MIFYQEGQTDGSQSDIGLETDQLIGDNGKESLVLLFGVLFFIFHLFMIVAAKCVCSSLLSSTSESSWPVNRFSQIN